MLISPVCLTSPTFRLSGQELTLSTKGCKLLTHSASPLLMITNAHLTLLIRPMMTSQLLCLTSILRITLPLLSLAES